MSFRLLACFLVLAGAGRAQDLSGSWQGRALSMPFDGTRWNMRVALDARPGAPLYGTLFQVNATAPDTTVTFVLGGSQASGQLNLEMVRVVQYTGLRDITWCMGTISLTYSAAEEKLTGRSTLRPADRCLPHSITLYRIRLKSPASVPLGQPTTLRVSGQEVAWYSDPGLRHLVAKGNSFRTKLRKTTTFYLTQAFHPSRMGVAVPVTVQVGPSPAPPQPKPPVPVMASEAPVVLPNVLFRTGTAALLPESEPALHELLAKLRARPKMRLRIAGHTDRIGEAQKNVVLSEQRARAVRDFLVNGGITPDRLETEGYGHARLLHPAPDVRNRRVEVELINDRQRFWSVFMLHA